ncbi:retrovirus-related pol polyprotein from transposon TNT 1-94 [Tanacetum coccineum]
MLQAFPMSLTGAASLWLRNEPSSSITNWETLKTKFLNKYCPPVRTAKKMDEQTSCECFLKRIQFESPLRVPNWTACAYRDTWSKTASRWLRNKPAGVQTPVNFHDQPLISSSTSWKSSLDLEDISSLSAKSYKKEDSEGTRWRGGVMDMPYQIQAYAVLELTDQYHICVKQIPFFLATTTLTGVMSGRKKDPGSFTLLCFIHNVCFDKTLVDLGVSVSVIPFSTYTNLGLGDLAHPRLTIELADKTIKHPRGIAENVLVRIGKFMFPLDFIILDIPEDDDVPLILGRPFLSTAHAKIDVYKRKFTLWVGEEKIVFKSNKPATSIIRRVYMLRTNLDFKTNLIGEDVNKSFDPHYGDYIELNDLDVPLEPRMNQDDNFKPTIDEIINVNKSSNKCCYKMKFSCMIGYKHVNAYFLPTLSFYLITKRFYDSIIKDKGDHKGKKLAGTLINIPIFVGNFSIISGFSIIDDMDVTSGVVLGMPFCKKFMSCQKIMEKFAHGDECE